MKITFKKNNGRVSRKKINETRKNLMRVSESVTGDPMLDSSLIEAGKQVVSAFDSLVKSAKGIFAVDMGGLGEFSKFLKANANTISDPKSLEAFSNSLRDTKFGEYYQKFNYIKERYFKQFQIYYRTHMHLVPLEYRHRKPSVITFMTRFNEIARTIKKVDLVMKLEAEREFLLAFRDVLKYNRKTESGLEVKPSNRLIEKIKKSAEALESYVSGASHEEYLEAFEEATSLLQGAINKMDKINESKFEEYLQKIIAEEVRKLLEQKERGFPLIESSEEDSITGGAIMREIMRMLGIDSKDDKLPEDPFEAERKKKEERDRAYRASFGGAGDLSGGKLQGHDWKLGPKKGRPLPSS